MTDQCLISGVFTKLQRATHSFVMAVCLSVSPHGTQLALDGFSRNSEHFSKKCQ